MATGILGIFFVGMHSTKHCFWWLNIHAIRLASRLTAAQQKLWRLQVIDILKESWFSAEI